MSYICSVCLQQFAGAPADQAGFGWQPAISPQEKADVDTRYPTIEERWQAARNGVDLFPGHKPVSNLPRCRACSEQENADFAEFENERRMRRPRDDDLLTP